MQILQDIKIFLKIAPPIRWIHTQVSRLANDPRRSFVWLGAKKDESPRGVIAVEPAHLMSLLNIF